MSIRIKLVYTDDPHTRLRSGDMGTLLSMRHDITGLHVLNVRWDSGSTLSLIEGQDIWETIEDDSEDIHDYIGHA
jgi:hypothetical protein